MYLTLIALPFIGSAFAGLRGRSLGSTGSRWLTVVSIFVTSVLALVAFYEVALCRSPVTVVLGSWVDSGLLSVRWGFTFDDLTVSILIPVLIVSSLVHLYSINYMNNDPHLSRFMSYLSLFTAFMVLLVTGNSYLILFIGWEGIGIASYLLIGFWLTRVQAQKSAIKALTVNRVGDMILSIGFFVMLWACGNLDYATVLSVAPYLNETTATLIGLLLFGGAMSKSAQLPLQTWLPDRMEGPTPVSALIHAATLVTAGVYLMLRSTPLLEYGPTTLIVITWLGAFTALFRASVGLVQSDIKKTIAFSTCSQLGYMFIAVGISQYEVALFHLVNHAMFKALLFLAAGSVLHAMSDQQDMRRLGGLVSFLPLTYVSILIGSLSLIALPGLTGYYSKDAILELGAASYTFSGTGVYWLGTLAARATAFYSIRLICLTFLVTPSGSKKLYETTHEATYEVVVPLIRLSILSIGFGYFASDLFHGMGTDFLSSSCYCDPNNVVSVESHFRVPTFYKILPSLITLFGAISAFILYHFNFSLITGLTSSGVGKNIFAFRSNQWRWNARITGRVIMPVLNLGITISKSVDRGTIETVGPYGLSRVVSSLSNSIAEYDTNVVTSYALYIMLGLLTLMLMVFGPRVGIGSDIRIYIIFIAGISLIY